MTKTETINKKRQTVNIPTAVYLLFDHVTNVNKSFIKNLDNVCVLVPSL